jgi:hypothetical protein
MSRVKILALATALAIAAAGVALPGNAWAQSFHVNDFSCQSPFSVHVDVGGVGNTDLCVTGSATVNLSCACVGGGGNCPQDAAKQTIPTATSVDQKIQPKNGQVVANVTLPISLTDASCTAPQCGNGQKTRLIKYATPGATFTVCKLAPGQSCTSTTCTSANTLATTTCGPASATVFSGKNGSCAALFP